MTAPRGKVMFSYCRHPKKKKGEPKNKKRREESAVREESPALVEYA